MPANKRFAALLRRRRPFVNSLNFLSGVLNEGLRASGALWTTSFGLAVGSDVYTALRHKVWLILRAHPLHLDLKAIEPTR
ncbi:hypothetical protein DB728_06910 [Rhizobium leguminosarum bv. viciae USDA 2370]|nr:hypothetical protein CHR56_37265 [Rhizobium leguminosarum bv. viciae]OOO52046.1 hypothetical protein BS629_10190 [Rhizobium leguminosarum bv. viciae USDA 2370]PUB65255.1 hypothetical protein DB728_06910 [Rhizobium leguminosarum bv. viciae USDA 2370]